MITRTTLEDERTLTNNDPLVSEGGRYVVGYDASPASRAAAGWALARAERTGAAVELVAVADEDAGGMGALYGAEAVGLAARALSSAADDLAEAHPAVELTTRVAHGSVATALADAADPQDLVVIGSDKTGYARGRVYGTRSVQLAAAARGPIAVVPSVDLRLRSGVVVAVADDPTAVELARLAAREAVRRGGELVLVHAETAGSARGGGAILAEARAAIAECAPDLEIVSHRAQRRPADVILNVARSHALLVVGRSRETSPLGVSPTLHDVLMNANAPVVVV